MIFPVVLNNLPITMRTVGFSFWLALRVWCMDIISSPHASVLNAQKSTTCPVPSQLTRFQDHCGQQQSDPSLSLIALHPTCIPSELIIFNLSPFFRCVALPFPAGMSCRVSVSTGAASNVAAPLTHRGIPPAWSLTNVAEHTLTSDLKDPRLKHLKPL